MSSKTKILQTAQDLFHERGYQQTSVDDITKESGVTKSNFYYHFRSKEELGVTALKERISLYETEVLTETLENRSLSPYMRLKEFYKRAKKYHGSQEMPKGCPFGNLAIEMSAVNENFREVLSEFFSSWEKKIEKCVREGIASGEFRDDLPPKAIAQLILSHLEGAIMMVKTQRSINPLSRGSETIMKIVKAA